MLLQVASRLLFAPSPNRLGAVTCDRDTAGGGRQDLSGSPEAGTRVGTYSRYPPRHCASQSSVFARPPWPSILSLVPLFSLRFGLTLFGFFWSILYLRNARCPQQVSTKQKKLSSCPPNATRLASSGSGELLLHPLALTLTSLSFCTTEYPDLLPSPSAVWATLRTDHAHATLSNHSTIVHITSHVFVQRL